ncbi:concanavalin A-like lectin/glucanase [Trametes punicea]|nr:concanavalin A-like lectin/glucanase [Trametes punicea]
MYALVRFCLILSGLASIVASGASGIGTSRTRASSRLELRQHWSRTKASRCTPFSVSLDSSKAADFHRSFTAISPPGSYELDSDGLHLFLDRPHGQVVTHGNVNDKVAEGATINSTFSLLYGTVTFTLAGPAVPGVVTAAILIADEHDEIDIELVGGDPKHWQTNVFAPAPHDDQPLYGVFGEIEDYPHSQNSVNKTHAYTIDWNEERVQWSVDGTEVRTLRKADTKKNGALHYPAHPARLQLGIWDASSPAGTSEWARGPIDWDSAPRRMSAVFESIEVKCPY